MLENIIQQTQKEYEAAHDDKIYDNHQYNIQYIHQNCRIFLQFILFLSKNIAQKFIKSIKIGQIWQMKNYIIFDIDRKRMHDKLAIFDAKAALIDEKSLNRLNRELREVQM